MAAEKGNKYAEGNGRPTKYKEEFDELAYNYCLLGATDEQLANFFEVTETTINNWKNEHESFFESIRAGKDFADMEIAKTLYDACKGTIVKKQKEVKVKEVDPDTKKLIDKVKIVDLIEQLPGDVNAMKFWLTNRQKENWRNRQDHTTDGSPINNNKLDYSKYTDSELDELEKLLKKGIIDN